MANDELRKKWEARISEFKASGQSGAAWCAENNVNLHQFYYWVRQFKSSNSVDVKTSKWLSLEISNQSQDLTSNLLVRIGEVTIEVKPDYNPDLLLNVIRTLRTLC
jgi:transposase-like protein